MKTLILLVILTVTASCRGTSVSVNPPIVQPGAPGAASRIIGAAQASDLSKVDYTEADVKFMQGMIHHHAQAVDMVDLLKTRTTREEMKLLGLRIELSQVDEINMMRKWLADRGQAVPDEHAHHMPGAPLMPGMLTPQEMARLGEVKGTEFDRLFLEGMIKHHHGAIIMVDDLFATPGAGQESIIFAFASDVVADQSAEIERMGAMLNAILKELKK
ncbi:MAG: DUF305 domain-containing protein [Acidobacteria bacterium]|nr:DUF305 domain-containing protein [Acidobacteriota bacterium]